MRPILGLLFCATLAAQPASVDGTAVNHATGQPLKGVHVRLIAEDFENGLDSVYGAISDRAGHFSIADLKPGIYIVSPERNGFVPMPRPKPSADGNFLPLKAGQHLADYKLEMTPRATLSGRVVDEYGDPVPQVNVELEPLTRGGEFFFGDSRYPTDDQGTFHMTAVPGRYYLHANIYAGQVAPAEIRTDGSSGAAFVSTYYPGAANKDAATVVEAASGQDVAGLEIRLLRNAAAAEGSGASISGAVTGAPQAGMTQVILLHGESFDELYNSSSVQIEPDGKFHFRGLEPGAYRISAHYSSLDNTVLRSQPVDLTLDGAREESVQLVLHAAEEITGTLEIDGQPPGAAKYTVQLLPADSFDNVGDDLSEPGAVDPKGAFRIADISPMRFRVVVDPMPENAFVQSVVLNGTAGADDTVDLSGGAKGAHLKIAVSRNGAQLSGAVLDAQGQPTASPMVMIFLVDDPKKLRRMDPSAMNKAVEGKYSVKAIRPGKYRLFAVDLLAMAASAPDTDDDEGAMPKAMFDAAEEIEIKAGDRIVQDLKAIEKLPGKEPPHAAQNQ